VNFFFFVFTHETKRVSNDYDQQTFAIGKVASTHNFEPDVNGLSVNKCDAFPKRNVVGGDQNSTRLDNLIYIF